MNYGEIKKIDIANGNGCRVSLFVSGCSNHCKGCFQPETWDFCYGQAYTKETEDEIFQALLPSYIQGLSLLGGDPFEPANQKALLPLLEKVRSELPGKDVWAWTGYIMDRDLIPGGRVYTEDTQRLLSMIDVLVDGPFIQEQKNLSLQFRGSENQRIINVPESLKQQTIVLFDPRNA